MYGVNECNVQDECMCLAEKRKEKTSDNIEAITFKLGMTVVLWMPLRLCAHARFDDDLDARSKWVSKGNHRCMLKALSATKQ